VPVGDGDLAGDQGGFSAVAVLEHFQRVVAAPRASEARDPSRRG
jgi:hypothetical protein